MVLLPRGLHLVNALLSVITSGLVYVPLDVTYPFERLNFICKHTQAPYIITCRDYGTLLEESSYASNFLFYQKTTCRQLFKVCHANQYTLTKWWLRSMVHWFQTWKRIHFPHLSILLRTYIIIRSEFIDNKNRYIIYTSGSTGEPKGVAVEYRD